MNKIKIIVFLSALRFSGVAQNGNTSETFTPDAVKHIEQECKYPGGQDALLKDISSHFIVPKKVRKDNLQGKIYLQITVDTLGFSKGKVLKGIRADVDSAAIDMVKTLKQFDPAKMDNKKIPTTLQIPLKI